MSDPKYNKYKGTVRFDDDNIVDIDLQPDTENITVLLNGEEVTGGSGLPEVDSEDNGKVLTVVEGEWAAANQTAELPAVSGADDGDVLTVVNGSWAKATPAVGIVYFDVTLTYDDQTGDTTVNTLTTTDDIKGFINSGLHPLAKVQWSGDLAYMIYNLSSIDMTGNTFVFEQINVDETTGITRYYITFIKVGEVGTANFDYTAYPTQPT